MNVVSFSSRWWKIAPDAIHPGLRKTMRDLLQECPDESQVVRLEGRVRPMTFRYIAVEGPPGVGKTELSKGLAARLDGAALHEEKNNPFLRDFLAGKGGAAFQAQIFFLLNRYRQLSGLAQRELFSQTQISDFILNRDKVYAYLHLDDTELLLYEKIYRPLAVEVPSPELVVYLQVPARGARETLAAALRGRRHGRRGFARDRPRV